jgi:transposase
VTGQRKSIKIFGCVNIVDAKFIYRRDTVFNAETYLEFLEQVARQYYRKSKKKIFYIQDNASYHKDEMVWEWFSDHRKYIEVYNLPPYSPEFNAAEPLWKHTRKIGTHNRYFDNENAIMDTLTKVFKGIQKNPKHIEGYIKPFR